MRFEVDTSELTGLATQMRARGARSNGAVAEALATIVPQIEAQAIEAMKAVTPVAKDDGNYWQTAGQVAGGSTVMMENTKQGGALRDSTAGFVEEMDGGTQISIIQDAESAPNWDGSGGGYHYGQRVRSGFDGKIYPVTKQALAGPGFGPVHSAGPFKADPYPDEAAPVIGALVAEAMQEGAITMMQAIMAAP